MITGNAARLHAAQEALLHFIQAGRVPDAKARAALERSPAGWPVTRDELARQIKQRLDGRMPDQLETSYCGPAAFLACLIHDRPDIYVAYAISLWQHGHFSFGNSRATIAAASGHGVIPSAVALTAARTRDPRRPHINDVDWMTMSCLSASTRPLNTGAVGPNDQFGSITYPWIVRRWFVAAGATLRADTMGMGVMKSGLLQTLSLMRYWSSSWIVLQIDSSLLQAGNPNTFANRHWVVVDPHHQPLAYKQPGNVPLQLGDAVEEMMRIAAQRVRNGGGIQNVDESTVADAVTGNPIADWTTNLRVISWGDEQHGIFSGKVGRLIDRVYGGFAFSRFA